MRSRFRPEVIQPGDVVPRTAVRRVSVDPIVTPRRGVAFAEEPEITLKASAFGKIREHAESELRSEVGGLLIGELFKDATGHGHVVIADAISATETVATAASVVFTLDTWKLLLERKATEFGNEAIVGWYHTHPGFGVFLSSWDLFLHRHFFPRPWHLALVVDPVGHSAAFFLTTPDTVIQRNSFNIRLDGSELGETGLANSVQRPPASLDGQLGTQVQLRRALYLEKPPCAIAAAAGWLCAALSSKGLAVKNVSATSARFLQLPHKDDVDEVAFDESEELYILSCACREIWRLNPSKPDGAERLTVEGYAGWETSLPAELAVVQKKIAIRNGNRLLLFKPDGICLKFVSEVDLAEVRISTGLQACNYQVAVSGSRLLINTPNDDGIAVISVGSEPEHSIWRGADTGLRRPLAIAASAQRVFALDSEGTRIVVLNLKGKPQQEYILGAGVREHSAIGLAATANQLYLAVEDGVFELELR